ncbi:SH3 domain-containing protein [Aureimonas fodinaquatilis]|uniref:SH3 domain-containing protein n=1 Tax=Aureimonas fodinaquatilis TaxID=2565783 RepID=A0A5B0DY90_9HYPH|nr:SH3 domain-containing protein [Aureimonas fodinaquatilis]KAA0971744.1 SH3 domain-containing protein [Aureimonas fodinaquatilis]
MKKPRRKTTRKSPAKSSIGMGWWIAGVVAIGWIVHSSNPTLLDSAMRQLNFAQQQAKPAAPSAPRVAARQPVTATPNTQTQRQASLTTPRPQTAPAKPVKQQAAAPASAPASRLQPKPALTTTRVQLRAEPSTTASIRTTLDAGQKVRVVDNKGEWQRVDAGIFTGWVKAQYLRDETLAKAVKPPAPVATASRQNKAPPIPPAPLAGTAQ